MPLPTPDPLPEGFGVEIDRAARLTDEGHVLVGGSPPRALRLSPGDVSTVIRWLSGAAPSHDRERRLARVLVEAGLAHPRPASVDPAPAPARPHSVSDHPAPDVEIAVVGTGDHLGLEAALARIAEAYPALSPVVVGATGLSVRVARERGLRVVTGPMSGAEARAAALKACDAGIVALLDAGTLPAPGWLEAALGHFADPGVAAVVPRVLPERLRCGPRGMFVASLSALHADRGADPAPVLPWGQGHHGPGRPAPPNEHASTEPLEPVPTLFVRRGTADPDPSLGAAAEVDLLWRLAEEGWSVRYEPRSRVRTVMPTGIHSYLSGRFEAGAAAAPLARRHGRWAAGPELSLWDAAALGLVLAGRPLPGLAVCAAGAAVRVRGLVSGTGTPVADAVRPVATDLGHTARTAARVARTTWWPLVAAVAVSGVGRGGRSGRRALAATALLTVPHLLSWRRRHGAAPVGPVAWTGLSAAGDAARSLGTWWGMARTGSPAPLVPRGRPPVPSASLSFSQVEAGSEASVRKPGSRSPVSGG
ncbi:glycosyltransferase [Nocardiopsis ganjiahuensis]|uniref:glycosyltransferase n=1 Tax=Nocardiopsis ganjiahuensis TaxID=239984 RepID=UPI000345D0C2|nr:glycosyltransferase [Nocardiopsis ganjiahuensis]